MTVSSIYNFIVQLSPKIEVLFRKIYWANISRFSGLKPNNKHFDDTSDNIDFEKVIINLKKRGIDKGSLIIVHSSYNLLEKSGLSPEEINFKLLELVGAEGTLVMPVIRKYKQEGTLKEYLTKNLDSIICTYNVQKSVVTSGLLPYYLMQIPGCIVSRFPINPVAAVGKHARDIVAKNLEGDILSGHGPNSSWKYCVDKNAIVIGLGVDMPHYLTITHVNEDCDANWPIKDWYRKRKFEIIDKSFETQVEVFERKPKWGALYFAERKYRKDLLKNGILKIEVVEGLFISTIESSKLTDFLKSNPRKGYPYYVGAGLLKD
jgi:aminoglycoside 3-N-acetyltransferase